MECAHCKKPANLACGACKTAPVLENDAPIDQYCDATCQKSHWISHKPVCTRLKDRKHFFRSVDTMRKLFLIQQELSWGSLDIRGIVKHEDVMVFRATKLDNPVWPTDSKVFPSHLMTTEFDKEVALSFQSCQSALHWLNHFLEAFAPVIKKSVRVQFATKNDKLRCRRYERFCRKAFVDDPTAEASGMEIFVNLMNLGILMWQQRGGVALKSVWKMGDEDFQRVQRNLVEFLDWFYHDHVNHVYEESPLMAARFYPSSSFTPRGKALAERIPSIAFWDFKK